MIMKMMSRTSTTSTKGTMLISESEVCVDLESCGIFHDSSKAAGWGGREILVKCLFDLGREFQSKSVEALGEVANLLQKMIIEDDGGNRSAQSRGRGHERFRNARSNSAEAGGAGAAEAGKGIDDAPNGAEETDEGSHGAGGGQPGHAFFDAANLVGGSQLHADGDGLQAF